MEYLGAMKLGELAKTIGCDLEGDPALDVQGPAPIDDAGPGTITFVANPRYRARLATLRASAVILAPGVECAAGTAVLRSPNPYLAFVRALEVFDRPYRPAPGVHPTASVAPSAVIGPRASIGAFAVIAERVELGGDARIDAHVVIYPDVRIGERFVAHAGAVVRERVIIGDDVKIQAGAVVGGDGFGYTLDDQGGVRAIPQIGTVVLEDGVEIGANATIDRATVGVTRLRRGAKIDNLAMVAHGCDVGEQAFLAAQVGLSGSTRVGAGAQLGGQVGAAGHLTIGAGSRVAAQSGVKNDLPPGGSYGGYPAIEISRWRRLIAASLALPDLLRRLRRVERALGLRRSADEQA